jgi:hypothetical protein
VGRNMDSHTKCSWPSTHTSSPAARGLSGALAQAGLEQLKQLKQCSNSLYTEFCSSGTCLSALKQP